MKRQSLVFSLSVLILLIGSNAMGDVDLDFGLKAGASFTRMRVDSEFVNLGNRIAFAGGGIVILNFSETWAIQLEGLYSPKGSSEDFELTDENGISTGTEKGTFHLDYFEVPLLARFSPGGGPIFLIAGPAMAYKVTSKFTIEGYPDEELDWIKSSDLGLVFGVGASSNTGLGKVEFDLRYTLGMSNINGGDGASVKNGGVLAMVGLVF